MKEGRRSEGVISMLQTVLWKLLAFAQVGLLLHVLPEYVLRPNWSLYLSWLGEDAAMKANVLGVPSLHVVVLVCANALFYLIYSLEWPCFEQHKIVKSAPWLWKSSSAEDKQAVSATISKSILLTAFNVLLTVPLSWMNYALSLQFGYTAALSQFPGFATILSQIACFMLIEDLLFYCGHRLLHQVPFLYINVHKLHHTYNKKMQSISIAAESTHPVEFIISNVVPFAAGPLLFGAHCVTLYVWVIWRIGETVTNHSGYEFPWSPYALLPFTGSAVAHDLHHSIGGGIGKNSGNFGSFFCWWDKILGTELKVTKDS